MSIHLNLLGYWVLSDEINVLNRNVLEFLVFKESSISLRKILSRARRKTANTDLLLVKCRLVSSNSVFRGPVIIGSKIRELFQMFLIHPWGVMLLSEIVVV
jgi:hypothetical protein